MSVYGAQCPVSHADRQNLCCAQSLCIMLDVMYLSRRLVCMHWYRMLDDVTPWSGQSALLNVRLLCLQYCMPTDAPHLSKHGALAMAMSPLLWQRFKPDRFDSYSAGTALLLQQPICSFVLSAISSLDACLDLEKSYPTCPCSISCLK